ncbi:hypothetical protein B0J14DRAFT_569991 [Halenospora varia]|nr:hypothetical protein B0J14DRAFT_569991 [Halenospora varia]
MHSSLFRCGNQGCGSKVAQSFDKFGVRRDGKTPRVGGGIPPAATGCDTGEEDTSDPEKSIPALTRLLDKARMIRYLESIIVQSLDLDIDSRTNVEPEVMPPSTKVPETDDEFHVRLFTDSYAVASKKQLHSSNHNATCFKYNQKGLHMPRTPVFS